MQETQTNLYTGTKVSWIPYLLQTQKKQQMEEKKCVSVPLI